MQEAMPVRRCDQPLKPEALPAVIRLRWPRAAPRAGVTPARVEGNAVKKLLIIIKVFIIALAAAPGEGSDGGPLPRGAVADRVVVEKSSRRLTLLRNGSAFKTYRIALGRSPVGNKEREGDNRTPEGVYRIDRRNARSQYHRSLHISYPTALEAERARKRGVSPGGDIMIHGLPRAYARIGSLHRVMDWTAGCIAVTNPEIEEIWRAVPDGTTIEIKP